MENNLYGIQKIKTRSFILGDKVILWKRPRQHGTIIYPFFGMEKAKVITLKETW
jgi:hypothetical protein